jgi:acyl carrier protein
MILEYQERVSTRTGSMRSSSARNPLISSGIVDSFSMVSLKRFLEKKHSVSIPDEDATPQAFDTVTSIIDLVNRFRKGRGHCHPAAIHDALAAELQSIRDKASSGGAPDPSRAVGGHRCRVPAWGPAST